MIILRQKEYNWISNTIRTAKQGATRALETTKRNVSKASKGFVAGVKAGTKEGTSAGISRFIKDKAEATRLANAIGKRNIPKDLPVLENVKAQFRNVGKAERIGNILGMKGGVQEAYKTGYNTAKKTARRMVNS